MNVALPSGHMASLAEVHEWLDGALPRDHPRPSDEACYQFAREFQILINRANNAELEKRLGSPLPIQMAKDLSPKEELDKRVAPVMQAASHLLATIEDLQAYTLDYEWTRSGETITMWDVEKVLVGMGAFPRHMPPPPQPERGQPRAVWHQVGRPLVPLIQTLMREIGYTARLRSKDEESATAIIGAAAISWAYGQEISSAGFATAMRYRNRKKAARP